MTTLVEVRDALVQHFENGWLHKVQVPAFYENKGTLSLDNITGDYFLYVRIKFTSAEQISLGPKPLMRRWGRVEVNLFSREGKGVRDELGFLDDLTEIFKFKALGGLTTEAPTPSRTEDHDGWHSALFIVPFFADIQ